MMVLAWALFAVALTTIALGIDNSSPLLIGVGWGFVFLTFAALGARRKK